MHERFPSYDNVSVGPRHPRVIIINRLSIADVRIVAIMLLASFCGQLEIIILIYRKCFRHVDNAYLIYISPLNIVSVLHLTAPSTGA